MSEIVNASAVRFDSLSATGDGYTLLSINGKVYKSDKFLSEMVQSAVDSEHFATEQWVNDQGFLKEHQSLDGYAKESWVSANYYDVDEVNALVEEASAKAYDEAVDWVSAQNYLTGVDLSNYYTKTETSGKGEISAALEIKQDLIQNKKDSSIPYLETSSSNPSWEIIESEQINAHGTAEEGKTYTIAINDRPYKTVCIGGKLWLAENYIDESHALYTDEDYGSYFMANTISQYIPQGWHLPSKEEWELLQNAHSDELEKLFSTDWHTDPSRPDYIQCTNELKLNLTPGGYYNRNTSEVLQKGYNSYYATSTFEVLSSSSGQQRVYVKLKNCVEHKSQMISFDWDGPRKADSSYPSNIRLIKDDLDVSGPDCWKTFKGKKFMAIADDEGNTLKDFYLKKAEAQATYQPKGSYASSAGVETLNTYYALTTTGWKDIAEGFYDKTSIDNSLNLKQDNLLFSGENNTITAINNSAIGGGGGATGEYVPLSALRCTIGSGNEVNTSTSYFALAQGSANSAIENAFAQGNSNYANSKSIAQGKNNSALYTSFAQGESNYANNYCFTQGYKNYASNYGLAQGTANSAEQESFANGIGNTAQYFSIAVGDSNSANQKSLAVGMNNSASYMGITIGTANSANMAFACGEQSRGNLKSVAIGYKTSADNMGAAFGDEVSAYHDALAQGGSVIAKNSSLAQGYSVTAREQAFAQGGTVSAYSNAFAQGQQVTATDISFAQGLRTKADNHSFVQGENIWAIDGGYSFGQGSNVTVTNSAMAQGYNVNASSGSLAQGNSVTATNYSLAQGHQIAAESASFAQGYQNAARTASFAQGQGNSAINTGFAAGISNTAEIDSFAQGYYCSANSRSIAQGENVTAYNYAIAQGSDSLAISQSIAQGYHVTASGCSFANGNNAKSFDYSISQGIHASAMSYSFAQGSAISANERAFAQGLSSIANRRSFAQGDTSDARNESFAQGYQVTAKTVAFAQGYTATAGNYSLAQGQYTYATSYSLAQGYSTTATSYSLAQGRDTIADKYSVAQGYYVTAGSASFAQGQGTSNKGITAYTASFAQGKDCVATNTAFAQGDICTATNRSFAQGYWCSAANTAFAQGEGIHVTSGTIGFGKYNKTMSGAAFVIGNGTNYNNRSDLFIIYPDGGVSATGNISANGVELGGGSTVNLSGENGISVTPSGDGYVIGVSASSELSAGAGIAITTAANATTISLSGNVNSLMTLLENKPATGQPYMLGIDSNGNLTWLAM